MSKLDAPKVSESGAWPATLAEIPGDVRERVRLALLEQLAEGQAPRKRVTLAATRRLAKADQRKVSALVKAWRKGDTPGLAHRWDRESGGESPAPSEDHQDESAGARIADLIEAATTHEARDEALRAIGAAVLRTEITKDQAQQARQTLGEVRLSGKDAREIPPEDPERIYLVSKDGALLVEAFERIVADERRERVLELVHEILEEDVEALPAVDPVGSL